MSSAIKNYSTEVTPGSNSSHAHILRFVSKNCNVLEIGAGPGANARALIKYNNCRMSAVEIDTACVDILNTVCEQVWQRDINNPTWIQDIPKNTYDAVVLADVLEHLIDPYTTLHQVSDLLTEDGSIVISLPHTSHAAILACLINNDFSYRDAGLLDRTHLRFFSIKNMQALVENAGLTIIDFAFVTLHPIHTEFADVWHNLPLRTQFMLEQTDFAEVYQVVIHAIPTQRAAGRVSCSLMDHPPIRQYHVNHSPIQLHRFLKSFAAVLKHIPVLYSVALFCFKIARKIKQKIITSVKS